MRRGALAALPIAVLLLAPAAVVAQAPADMPELTDAQLHRQAAVNANALMAVSIAESRARGVSPREWGLRVGREFAASWGEDHTPRTIVRGMWSNLLSLNPGITLRVGEYDDDLASILLPPDYPAFAGSPEQWFGVGREEFRDAVAGMAEGIAARFGLLAGIETGPDGPALFVRR